MTSTPLPIKTCEYCGATGSMPTFMGGETTCANCRKLYPIDGRECRHEIKRLRTELQDVLDWARTENAPLRTQEIASIERTLTHNAEITGG